MRSNPTAFIHIIGMNKLQNNLLLSYLKEKNNLMGRCSQKLESATHAHEKKLTLQQLLLLDYPTIYEDDFWPKLSTWKRSTVSKCLVALYNIESETEVEKTALKNDIQGIFYEDDPPSIIAKGVSVILKGDIWYSRKSLKKYVIESNPSINIPDHVNSSDLTFREKEILAYVAAGYSNEAIADSLCISYHTVKTHIYKIYRKINVNNRLQAALWAVKCL